MKTLLSLPLRLLGLSALLMPLLTACPGDPPPLFPPGFSLSFNYPVSADTTGLSLAAIGFKSDSKVSVVSGYASYNKYVAYSSPVYIPPTPNSLYVDGYSLQNFLSPSGGNCAAYTPAPDAPSTQLVVTPADVKTCAVFFVAFKDVNGDGVPQTTEEKYMTHDILSYASSDYTYSDVSADGKSTESASLKAGWTLARHTVLQPIATPGQYKVTLVSVPTADQGVAIQLHEPTPYFRSQSAAVGGGLQ